MPASSTAWSTRRTSKDVQMHDCTGDLLSEQGCLLPFVDCVTLTGCRDIKGGHLGSAVLLTWDCCRGQAFSTVLLLSFSNLAVLLRSWALSSLPLLTCSCPVYPCLGFLFVGVISVQILSWLQADYLTLAQTSRKLAKAGLAFHPLKRDYTLYRGFLVFKCTVV